MEDIFPMIRDIEDEDLASEVVDIWMSVMEQSEFEHVSDVPNFPDRFLNGLDDQDLDAHIRWTTHLALAISESLTETIGVDVDKDIMIAGSLLHDISKPLEHDAQGMESEIGRKFPHPHYAGPILGATDVPEDIRHIAMSHSPFTAVDPETLEAFIIQMGDLVAANAYYSQKPYNLFSI